MIQHDSPYEGMCLSSDGALRGTSSGTASVAERDRGRRRPCRDALELQLKRAVKERDWDRGTNAFPPSNSNSKMYPQCAPGSCRFPSFHIAQTIHNNRKTVACL